MTADQAVAEVQQILGWRSDKATEILLALQYAQSQRERPGRTYPWFLRQVRTTPLVVGQVTYTLPSGFIQDSEERDGNLYYYLGTALASRPVFLKKVGYELLLQRNLGYYPSDSDDVDADVETGDPTEYAVDGSNILVFPIPDTVRTLYYRCWAADTTPTLGSTNLWLTHAPWVLVGEAAQKIGSDLENAAAVAKAQTILSRANRDLFVETVHRQEAGKRRSMGSRL